MKNFTQNVKKYVCICKKVGTRSLTNLPLTYGPQRLENIFPNESFSDFKTERNCKRFDVKKY